MDLRIWVEYLIAFLVIAMATWIAYANSFDAPFVFDDAHNISKNENLRIDNLHLDSILSSVLDNPTPRPVAYL
ncbi:MAG: hypothetical protein AAGA30_18000, partial [Planctomycetota bacterium]